MSTIDKQRIAAVRKLEQLGYTFAGDDWIHSANDAAAIARGKWQCAMEGASTSS